MGGALAKIVFKSGVDALPDVDSTLEDIEIMDIDGQMVRLGDVLSDKKVALFVNVATKWGLTADNYRQLTDLHE